MVQLLFEDGKFWLRQESSWFSWMGEMLGGIHYAAGIKYLSLSKQKVFGPITLIECLDNILCPRFTRLAENYLGLMLLFTNLYKKMKNADELFCTIHVTIQLKLQYFQPKKSTSL